MPSTPRPCAPERARSAVPLRTSPFLWAATVVALTLAPVASASAFPSAVSMEGPISAWSRPLGGSTDPGARDRGKSDEGKSPTENPGRGPGHDAPDRGDRRPRSESAPGSSSPVEPRKEPEPAPARDGAGGGAGSPSRTGTAPGSGETPRSDGPAGGSAAETNRAAATTRDMSSSSPGGRVGSDGTHVSPGASAFNGSLADTDLVAAITGVTSVGSETATGPVAPATSTVEHLGYATLESGSSPGSTRTASPLVDAVDQALLIGFSAAACLAALAAVWLRSRRQSRLRAANLRYAAAIARAASVGRTPSSADRGSAPVDSPASP